MSSTSEFSAYGQLPCYNIASRALTGSLLRAGKYPKLLRDPVALKVRIMLPNAFLTLQNIVANRYSWGHNSKSPTQGRLFSQDPFICSTPKSLLRLTRLMVDPS
jgi:hypothetical protein